MKRLILWLVRRHIDDHRFREQVCQEVHKFHENQFCDQTPPGRLYDACAEFFEASPYLNRLRNDRVIDVRLAEETDRWMTMLRKGVSNEFSRFVGISQE